jgi:hypothetical protein
MDVVYILGTGSKWSNNELRYSLRSLEKHLHGYHDIYVVGENPTFLKGVTHIPFPDNSTYNKQKNIYEKVLRACNESSISENFLFFNDDFFLLKTLDAYDTPFYHRGCLGPAVDARKAGDTYRTSLDNTYKALSKRGLPTLHYDIHLPIIYNKTLFKEYVPLFDWTKPYGYVVKSAYSNSIGVENGAYDPDCKIMRPHTRDQILNRVKDRCCFSIGDAGINHDMKKYLKELYPKPCRWEQ